MSEKQNKNKEKQKKGNITFYAGEELRNLLNEVAKKSAEGTVSRYVQRAVRAKIELESK